jgi:hypothetical protein
MKPPVFVVAFMMAVAPAIAAEPIHVPGIYSDLRYDKQTDDLSGTEIFIVPAAGGYTAFVQFAEGEAGAALAVPVKVNQDHVSFTVPEPSGGAGVYDGRISAREFVGTVTTTVNGKTNSTPIRLARKKSYWQ